MSNPRINSELVFNNVDAADGTTFFFLHMKWGGVPPVFVDGILDAMDSSVTPKLKEFRIAAQEARNKAAADAAAAAAANSPT